MRLYPDAAHRFVTDPAANLNTPASRGAYRQTLRLLQFRHPHEDIRDYTEDDLVAFANRAGLAPASRAAYRNRVRGFFAWAKWKGLIGDDPACNLSRLVRTSMRPVRVHRWLTETEVGTILGTLDLSRPKGRRDNIVARLGFTAGLRRNEIAGLRWDQLDLDRRQINLVGKGNKLATVYITERTQAHLIRWRTEVSEGLGRTPERDPVVPRIQTQANFATGETVRVVQWERRLTAQGVGLIVHHLSEASGVVFSPHDMRRSFAGMLEERGLPVERISAALRHTDIGTTQRYLEKRQDAAYLAVKESQLDL